MADISREETFRLKRIEISEKAEKWRLAKERADERAVNSAERRAKAQAKGEGGIFHNERDVYSFANFDTQEFLAAREKGHAWTVREFIVEFSPRLKDPGQLRKYLKRKKVLLIGSSRRKPHPTTEK